MTNHLAIYKFLKKTSCSKENVLVLPEFLKNKNFVESPKNIEFLRNKYIFNGKSPENV
jgi:hypothetical protein